MIDHSRSETYFKKRVKKWKDNEEKGRKKAEKEKHFSSQLGRLGRLSKGNAYQKNGYFQVKHSKQQDRLKVYKRSAQASENYSSTNDNFFSLKLPYPIQAHHILPKDSFSEANGFTYKQRTLLLRVPYDINHGENIIFLPESESDCKVHGLPSHYGSHPKYIDRVSNDIISIKDMLKNKEKPPCDDQDGPQMKILDELIGFQDVYWNFLAGSYKKFGKGSVEKHTDLDSGGAADSAGSGV